MVLVAYLQDLQEWRGKLDTQVKTYREVWWFLLLIHRGKHIWFVRIALVNGRLVYSGKENLALQSEMNSSMGLQYLFG